ncbi:MAG: hypothetical protein A3B86_03490 [Candidatus Yanofskybacteria bacterium RIFCSPHIGHO2_02_FULL_38_22b]|uniref:Uncharacterized protein n=1 Tax=Candidatus Yanofskybacteria bacterium RIFCSPHIGHO2_02_FULL_38_22b TaxID=1802673 RepID=A0A1F8F049_9BACT|nr:MAG: hypothetical protein A3B86_03490 [Candidatus Yanofskybacteria bacterium RIFCSPHIGHO2_02_FULL_38_22b]OGN19448.1 MAG: hypothetical protein A2910_02870 [Candidatus Yanofskybacteria bacterium RIFCSPLOWO2_01_FULL_39_28]
MIVIGIWNKVFKSSHFIFAENLEEYKKRCGPNWDLWYEIETTENVPEVVVDKIQILIDMNKDSQAAIDNIAAAFWFGLYCGQNEKRLLKTRLDELVIIAGKAGRCQDVTDLQKEIQILKEKLSKLG